MTIYRGARSIREQAVAGAIEQKAADKIAAKAQRVHKAAAKAKSAKDLADDHDNQLTTGVLKKLDIGGMAQLQRLQGALPNANLATIQDATKLAAGLVSSRELSDLAVSAAKLADYAVGTGKLGTNSVTIRAIADGQVTGPAIAPNAVTANAIAANSVTAGAIATNAVTAGSVAADAVTARSIAANAVVANAIAANAVLATHMATQSLAAFDLWASIAMIRSAWINNLTVDKLSAGTFTAGDIILAGGGRVLFGPGVTGSGSGFTLAPASGNNSTTSEIDRKISPPTGWGAYGFFLASGGNGEAGAQIRVDPVGSRDSKIALQAYAAGGGFAGIDVVAYGAGGNGRVTAYGNLYPSGGVEANYFCNASSVPANSYADWPHGLGTTQIDCQFQKDLNNGQWRPIEFIASLFVDFVGPGNVRVRNDTNTAQRVRGWLTKIV